MTLRKRTLENNLGKGESAGSHHFLFFPQYFLPYPTQRKFQYLIHMVIVQKFSIWTSPKFYHLVKS